MSYDDILDSAMELIREKGNTPALAATATFGKVWADLDDALLEELTLDGWKFRVNQALVASRKPQPDESHELVKVGTFRPAVAYNGKTFLGSQADRLTVSYMGADGTEKQLLAFDLDDWQRFSEVNRAKASAHTALRKLAEDAIKRMTDAGVQITGDLPAEDLAALNRRLES